VAFLAVLGVGAPARADGPFEGSWRVGPTRAEVAIESWGGDCGPRPASSSSGGGATIAVVQSGDDLTFQERPAHSTRGCWSENGSVRRVSSSFQAGTWRIVCRTPEDDPRAETGQTTLQATGTDRIDLRDVSRYDWQLNASHCVATVTTTRSFQRVAIAPEPAVVPAQPVTAPDVAEEAACTPGAAARIAFRPGQPVVPPGGRLCVSARVVDARGCPVPGRPVALALRTEGAPSVRLRGNCLEAETSGDGDAMLVATEGDLRGETRVRVLATDLSDLTAGRATSRGPLTGMAGATSEEAARLAAREASSTSSFLGPVVGSLLGLLLAAVAVVGLIVAGRNRAARRGARVEAAADGAAIAADRPPSDVPDPASREAKICPSCRRGHAPEAEVCVADGTTLVLYRDFASGTVDGASFATKSCPTCGTSYPKATRFCGKDGTTLPME
jgi:hypothetical protein